MAKAGVEFKRVTKGKGLSTVVKNTKDAFVKVGVLQGQGEHPNGDHGQTIAEVAFWNEFGTARIPPRPFLRSTLKERKIKYKALFAKILKAFSRKSQRSRVPQTPMQRSSARAGNKIHCSTRGP
jgi:cold shock CspA family protein